jgi:hypothetical protein
LELTNVNIENIKGHWSDFNRQLQSTILSLSLLKQPSSMKKLTLATLLILSCSLAWSAAFEGNDGKMKVFEFYAGVAGAAGSVQKCGMSNLDSTAALDKIAKALRCKHDDGELTSEDADAI